MWDDKLFNIEWFVGITENVIFVQILEWSEAISHVDI